MSYTSQVNPNFPIPGIDQSSRGFRDNFSIIKTEIEYIQNKNIVLTGDVVGNATISEGGQDVVISTNVTVQGINYSNSNVESYLSGNITVGNLTVNGNVIVSGEIISTPFRPAFRVRGLGSTEISSGNILLQSSGDGISVDHNVGSYYNNSTGEFTVPYSGLYSIFLNVSPVSNVTAGSVSIRKNTSAVDTNLLAYWEVLNSNGVNSFGVSSHSILNQGDTVDAYVSSGSVTFDNNNSWGITFVG